MNDFRNNTPKSIAGIEIDKIDDFSNIDDNHKEFIAKINHFYGFVKNITKTLINNNDFYDFHVFKEISPPTSKLASQG